MYKGKRENPKTTAGAKRKTVLVVSLVLILTMSIGATIAWLVDTTDPKVNAFTPGFVPPEIDEGFDGDVKEDVTVTNTGNVSAYIRAAIVATWQDDQGNIAPKAPVLGEDYSMTLASGTNWSEKQTDGYYYYKLPVAAGGTTGILIDEAKPLVPYDDYHLVIEIMTQTIQSEGVNSEGKTPVELAWGEAAARLVGAIE